MNKHIIFSVLFLFSVTCMANDMKEHMFKTDGLIKEGQYEEALERTIWFHNHVLEHRPSMYGVRLSFALNRWYKFGQFYPPALEALVEIRDFKTEQLLSGNGNKNLFHDVSSINRTLNENGRTVILFKALDEGQPKLAKKVWRIAKDKVIQEKEYSIAQKYIKNILKDYDKKEKEFNEEIARCNEKERNSQIISIKKEMFADEAIELIYLAIALNKNETAKEIKNRVINIVNDSRIESIKIK